MPGHIKSTTAPNKRAHFTGNKSLHHPAADDGSGKQSVCQPVRSTQSSVSHKGHQDMAGICAVYVPFAALAEELHTKPEHDLESNEKRCPCHKPRTSGHHLRSATAKTLVMPATGAVGEMVQQRSNAVHSGCYLRICKVRVTNNRPLSSGYVYLLVSFRVRIQSLT